MIITLAHLPSYDMSHDYTLAHMPSHADHMSIYLSIPFRDLKPENCMLSEMGHIILTDFGSAKMLELSEKATTIAGTPQYLAPEVLRGEPYSFSADWWSCGIILYEMLTGRVSQMER